MEWIGPLIVAVVLAAVIVLVARRWQGDRPEDRGPYSTAMEARAGLAGLGHTLDPAPGDNDDEADAARPDHD
jgi:hypothetical protein